MAVAVGEAQATVSTKILLGNGRSLYVGTLAFGTEYATGGDTLAAAAESRFALPEKIDAALIVGSTGYDFEFTAGKVKAFVSAAGAKEPSQEVASKKDLSAVTKAGFWLVGAS
jgi:hypothetical protein